MNEILSDNIKNREAETAEYRKACIELDAELSREDLTFAQAYDILLSEENKKLVSEKLWGYLFQRYNMPLSFFRDSNCAVLKYETFTLYVPIVKREGTHLWVEFKFDNPKCFNGSLAQIYRNYIKGISEAVEYLEDALSDGGLTCFDVIFSTSKGKSCAKTLSKSRSFLCGGLAPKIKFPVPKSYASFLFKRSRDAYINDALLCLKSRKMQLEEEVRNIEQAIAAERDYFEKIKPELSDVLALFEGSFYDGEYMPSRCSEELEEYLKSSLKA